MEDIEKLFTTEKEEIEGNIDEFLKKVIQASEKSKKAIYELIDRE